MKIKAYVSGFLFLFICAALNAQIFTPFGRGHGFANTQVPVPVYPCAPQVVRPAIVGGVVGAMIAGPRGAVIGGIVMSVWDSFTPTYWAFYPGPSYPNPIYSGQGFYAPPLCAPLSYGSSYATVVPQPIYSVYPLRPVYSHRDVRRDYRPAHEYRPTNRPQSRFGDHRGR